MKDALLACMSATSEMKKKGSPCSDKDCPQKLLLLTKSNISIVLCMNCFLILFHTLEREADSSSQELMLQA